MNGNPLIDGQCGRSDTRYKSVLVSDIALSVDNKSNWVHYIVDGSFPSLSLSFTTPVDDRGVLYGMSVMLTLNRPTLSLNSQDGVSFVVPDGFSLENIPRGVSIEFIFGKDNKWILAPWGVEDNRTVLVAGYFSSGFTFTSDKQIGIAPDGQWWSYNGSLPFTVPAGTVPSEPNYTNRGDAALRNALAAPDSTVLVGGVEAGDLADAYNQRRVDIRFFGVLFDGSDEGPKLRAALAAGVPLYFPPNKTIVVNFDPASAFDDGGVTRYSRCIAIPSNADLMFGSNFKIKGADGLQNWTRVVVMENVQNIKIHGALFVDGNVQNVGTPNNEHMHCVFMFNVKNTEIDTIHGINARGDNVFIGGSDEITFSDNVRIGSVIGTTAGRKNLVLHMADNLHIEYALLDNSAGGAAVYGGVPDDTDKHCLDLEPDAFTAAKVFRQYIGNLRTFGLGNDFTVGITPAVADAWQLTIGSAYCKQSGAMSGSVKAWLQYGVTINVLGDLQILDCEGVNRPVFLQYAARLNVGGKLKINGSCPNAGESMLFATASGGNTNTPRVRATELDISCTNGGGAILRSCHLKLDVIRLDCPAFGLIVGDNVDMAIHKAITNIDRLISTDTGTTYVMLVDTPVLAAPYVTVGEVLCYDTRGTKASAVFQIDSNNSANFTVGAVTELSGVPLVTWVGSDKYLKTSVQQYVCQGTPEGMIPAPIGSIASRLDGGVGTSFYVKELGVTATGWAAK